MTHQEFGILIFKKPKHFHTVPVITSMTSRLLTKCLHVDGAIVYVMCPYVRACVPVCTCVLASSRPRAVTSLSQNAVW